MKSSIRYAIEGGLKDCGLPEGAFLRILARVKNAITIDMIDVMEGCSTAPKSGLECMAALAARWNVLLDSERDEVKEDER